MLQQLEAIGCSADWSRTYFTFNDALSRAVREAFVRLYEKGLIYRGHYIINWCPRCLTALSNEEAEKEEEEGRIWRLRYPLAEGDGSITVATTRPETMLGDTGVAVHPDDDRYRRFVGRELRLPLTDRLIPVVADDAVDPAFGTGAVKITPAHDPLDFEIGRRHGLATIDVLTLEARMSLAAPERFQGLDRYEARRRCSKNRRQARWKRSLSGPATWGGTGPSRIHCACADRTSCSLARHRASSASAARAPPAIVFEASRSRSCCARSSVGDRFTGLLGCAAASSSTLASSFSIRLRVASGSSSVPAKAPGQAATIRATA